MSIQSKADTDKNEIPGFIQDALVKIVEYDTRMLSEYGLTIAHHFQMEREQYEQKIKEMAKKVDDFFDE